MADIKNTRESYSAGVMTTARTDWGDVIAEVFSRLIGKAPFGLGVVAREKTLLGASIRYRVNPAFSAQKVADFVRKSLTEKNFDVLFTNNQGLSEAGSPGLFKVSADGMGLPKNSLIIRVASTADSRFRAVVIFGGERLEGQLESRLKHLDDILSGAKKSDANSVETLVASLQKVNVKRLYDYDLNQLKTIANGLDHEINNLPKELRPKIKAINDYIMSKQIKR